MPLISNVRHRRSRIQMRNTRGAFALRCWATAERAARPASLASSARTAILEVVCSQASVRAARPLASGALLELLVEGVCAKSMVRREARLSNAVHSGGKETLGFVGRANGYVNSTCGQACWHSPQIQALHRSAKPNTRGRAGTSCFAARAGGARLLASVVTQRTMQAGSVVLRPLPNPSIERTSPGKPGAASHLKR